MTTSACTESRCTEAVISPQSARAVTRSPRAKRPPVIVVGGEQNALAIARSLARYGVTVHALSVAASPVRHSRYAKWISLPENIAVWREFLLGKETEHLRGSILLVASDPALEMLVYNHDAFAERYLLDDLNPSAQLKLLNKLSTYEAASAAGVSTPRFWTANGIGQLEELRSSFVFPLIVKPLLSHVFEERHGRKFFIAETFDDLLKVWQGIEDDQIEVMLVEKIAGLDDCLCSYYTYMDEHGEPLFALTKRVIRRNPPGEGGACYHVTDWVPDVCEPSLRLLRQVGLRGLANVEFKRDPNDDQLKLIECNARFTAPIYLLERAGFDLARFVYNRIVGLPQKPLKDFRRGLRLWYPFEDFHAFRSLQRQGELSLLRWLISISHRQLFPVFSWRDPMPTFADQMIRVKRRLRILGL